MEGQPDGVMVFHHLSKRARSDWAPGHPNQREAKAVATYSRGKVTSPMTTKRGGVAAALALWGDDPLAFAFAHPPFTTSSSSSSSSSASSTAANQNTAQHAESKA